VVREKVAPVRVRDRVDVGSILPEDVVLREAPGDWGPWGSRYRYVYSADGKVYLVELPPAVWCAQSTNWRALVRLYLSTNPEAGNV
jgi:hypothetical protein